MGRVGVTLGVVMVLAGSAWGNPQIMPHYEFYSDFEKADTTWRVPAGSTALAGERDNSRNHSPRDSWSLRCEQTPALRLARHVVDPGNAGSPIGDLPPEYLAVGNVGTVEVCFYDDGSARKSFLIAVEALMNDASDPTTVGLGLLDTDPAVQTNYVAQFHDTVIDSGVTRRVGWHKLEMTVTANEGSRIKLDGQNFAGNTTTTAMVGRFVTVRTDLGDPGDANQVWIDDVRYATLGKASPIAVAPNWTGHLELGGTGARIKIETNADGDGGSLAFEQSYESPGGTIPAGTMAQTEFGEIPIDCFACDRCWRITNMGLTNFTYRVQLPVQGIFGLTDSRLLCILKREGPASPWTPVSTGVVFG